MKNVLVFPCGSEIGLEIGRSLEFSKDFNLYGASSVDDHGLFVYENYISKIPFVEDDNFIDAICEVVKKYKIDFIFPAHDSVVLNLSQNQERIGAIVVTSPFKTCKICRSKKDTYELFKNIIDTPIVFNIEDNLKFPIFLKPNIGQGSKGTFKANNIEEVRFSIRRDASLMLLEYLPGKEYTIDCFTNKEGVLLFAQGRERVRVSNGISVNSRLENNEIFLEIANKINSTLVFRGVWFFQLKERADGKLVLLEISPRVAGTMSLSRVRGVNLPLLSLYDLMDVNVSILLNDFNIEIDRSLSAKYKMDISYKNVYIDFDDTLVLKNGNVNVSVIAFIYRCLNKNKSVFLITKHSGDIYKSLEYCKISKELFAEIIHIENDEHKFGFIKPESIFIDDSFSERNIVFKNLKIPVFDLDGMECL
ncbi:MAG TPA: carbamoylphosphate synthase large subunit short form [Candidatus Moranbacteria bacterium]|nr:carbamoylphosphate synthase large subunit short form [Candidatus Moranbacteria bacterium]HBT45301.1 carbamoylphosphate synthase large subunit short form [Candidatus Moranbacteria bacterium]